MTSTVTTSHREAMERVDEALEHERAGSAEEAARAWRGALGLESRAARETEVEPSRSVLYRSAASLALKCDEWREAERLACAGLAGTPPQEIADELRDVLREAQRRYAVAALASEVSALSASVSSDQLHRLTGALRGAAREWRFDLGALESEHGPTVLVRSGAAEDSLFVGRHFLMPADTED